MPYAVQSQKANGPNTCKQDSVVRNNWYLGMTLLVKGR